MKKLLLILITPLSLLSQTVVHETNEYMYPEPRYEIREGANGETEVYEYNEYMYPEQRYIIREEVEFNFDIDED